MSENTPRMTVEQIADSLREKTIIRGVEWDYEEWLRAPKYDNDGYAPDLTLVGCADSIKGLRVALASQIDISNALRERITGLERDLAAALERARYVVSVLDEALGNNDASVPVEKLARMAKKRIERAEAERDAAVKRGFLIGFCASHEGHNGEYPFGDRGINPEEDAKWLKWREAAIAEGKK